MFSAVSVQMMKMSSIYLARVSGLMGCVCRNDLKTEDMKILAIVGEKAAPMAVPFTCWKMWQPNMKLFMVMLMWRRRVMKFGSIVNRCECLDISV